MTVGDRVKERRKAAGLSQSALARRIGLDPSTISGLESGDAKSSRYLHAIARELRTTPAYLACETDDPMGDAEPPPISAEECDWIDMLRRVSADDRRALLRLARTIATAAGDLGRTVQDR